MRRISTKKSRRIQQIPTRFGLFQTKLNDIKQHERGLVDSIFMKLPATYMSCSRVEDPVDRKYPDWHIPEIAFAGSSNVGKSSLINALVGVNGLVKTSKTPGRTQQLNYFAVGGSPSVQPAFSIVDMPGYGFANAPKKMVDQWHQLVGDYIVDRKASNLKRVMILVDARHGIKKMDIEFMILMNELDVHYQVVFTKIDLSSYDQSKAHVDTIYNIVDNKYNRVRCLYSI